MIANGARLKRVVSDDFSEGDHVEVCDENSQELENRPSYQLPTSNKKVRFMDLFCIGKDTVFTTSEETGWLPIFI